MSNKERMIELMNEYNSEDPIRQKKAKEALFEENKKLIAFIMKKYAPSYIPVYGDDLYNELVCTFFEQLPNYDPEKGTLSTFLTAPFRRTISLFRNSVGKCNSAYYAKQMQQVQESIAQLEQDGKSVTTTNISLYSGLSLKRVSDSIFLLQATNETTYDGLTPDELDRLEKQMVSFAKSPEEELIIKEGENILQKAIQMLDEEDQKILMAKFGDDLNEERSLSDTAKFLGYPISKVKRSITRSLRVLRTNQELRAWYGRNEKYYTPADGIEMTLVPSEELLADYNLIDNFDSGKSVVQIKKDKMKLNFDEGDIPKILSM